MECSKRRGGARELRTDVAVPARLGQRFVDRLRGERIDRLAAPVSEFSLFYITNVARIGAAPQGAFLPSSSDPVTRPDRSRQVSVR